MGVRMVLVDGDPSHIVVAEGYWYHLFSRLSSVEELWLHPGTAEISLLLARLRRPPSVFKFVFSRGLLKGGP